MFRPATQLASAVVLLALPLTAAAQPVDAFPPRRPGGWEISMVTEKPAGAPPITMQMCVDAATDRELMDFGLRATRGNCKKYTMQRQGKNLVIDAECKLGPFHSVSHTVVSGDFQSKYTVRIEGTTQSKIAIGNMPKEPQPTLMTQTAHWIGATCGSGMKPGDIAMPGGVKFNVQKIKGLQKMLPALLGK